MTPLSLNLPFLLPSSFSVLYQTVKLLLALLCQDHQNTTLLQLQLQQQTPIPLHTHAYKKSRTLPTQPLNISNP